jgi:hypothetical protein
MDLGSALACSVVYVCREDGLLCTQFTSTPTALIDKFADLTSAWMGASGSLTNKTLNLKVC